MDKTHHINTIRQQDLNGVLGTHLLRGIIGSDRRQSSLQEPNKPSLAMCASLIAALALSACAGVHQADGPDEQAAAPKSMPAHAVPASSPARSSAAPSANAAGSKVEIATAEVQEERMVETVQAAPKSASQTVVETTTVIEKSGETAETTEFVETPKAIAERKETTTTTERIVDRVEIDEQNGRVTETVDVEVSTQKATDVVVVDKQTGEMVETVVQSAPVVKETEHMSVTVERRTGPKDTSRHFTGPDGTDLLQLASYGVVAVKTNSLTADRNRLIMICETFTSPTPGLDESSGVAPGMITAWPISSTAHADELNAAATSSDCVEAVERYGLSEGSKAIRDVERSGWILEDRGPFLLAWSPPLAKGSPGQPVLLADLSGVSTPEAALAVMHRWAVDVETNTALWNQGGWNVDRLRPVIEHWDEEFGPRVLMLLGPVGG